MISLEDDWVKRRIPIAFRGIGSLLDIDRRLIDLPSHQGRA
jgi:hypothetical protein